MEGLQAAAEDGTVSLVVLTGKGRAFTAGADLTEMASTRRSTAFPGSWSASSIT